GQDRQLFADLLQADGLRHPPQRLQGDLLLGHRGSFDGHTLLPGTVRGDVTHRTRPLHRLQSRVAATLYGFFASTGGTRMPATSSFFAFSFNFARSSALSSSHSSSYFFSNSACSSYTSRQPCAGGPSPSSISAYSHVSCEYSCAPPFCARMSYTTFAFGLW